MGKSFLWKYFFRSIWAKLDNNSTIKGENRIIKGIIIPTLIFSNSTATEINHHKLKAPLSPMNILAGLILNRKNAISIDITTPTSVVAIYILSVNMTTPMIARTILIIPPARPSRPSVILIAWVMNITRRKLSGINQNHKWKIPLHGHSITRSTPSFI